MTYAETPVYELLEQAARGRIGVDQRLLRSIVDRRDTALPDVVRFGLEDHLEDPVPLELELVQIFRMLRAPQALDYYMRILRIQPYDVADELLRAFCEVGAPAIDPLLALYEELGEEEGGDVAFVLAALGIHDDRITKILVERLQFDAWDAAITLGIYAHPDSGPAINKLLSELPDDAENQSLRRDLERALGEMSTERVPEVPPSPESLIEEYPDRETPDFDVLGEADRLELLTSEAADERTGAALSFVNQRISEPVRKKLFAAACDDPEAEVRGAAWRALSGETEDDEIFASMLVRVADESAPVVERRGAIVGLAFKLDDEQVRKFAESLYEAPETRAAAMEAMRRSLDASFATFFPKHLEDADPDVRREAIWGVGYLGIADSAEKLKQYFQDEDLRGDALFSYALSTRHETTRGRMKGLLRKIDELAGGLSEYDEELVKAALDERLALHGLDPVFEHSEEGTEAEHVHGPDCDHDHDPVAAAPVAAVAAPKVGRNDPCPCGSGKKYKKCHGA